jgi:hypothetical protein
MKKLNKKLTKKEFAKQWLLSDNEIKEWIKFKCILFATYEKQKISGI